MSKITLDMAVEWRVPIWSPAIQWALDHSNLSKDSNVLELGFCSGKMSCFLAQNLGWNMNSFECVEKYVEVANSNAKFYQVTDRTNFTYLHQDNTFSIQDKYDGIFLKSFLYHNKNMDKYLEWIKWLYDRLEVGGKLVLSENGQGHFLDRFYRSKVQQNNTWKENILYSSKIESELKKVFPNNEIKYFGGISQYLTPIAPLSHLAQKIERPNADNCFIVSIVATKT
jgi:cyclopropane fatty-acyl-phospholipid synthase-like methyltransferase